MVATWHFTSTGNLLPFMLCSEPADPLLWPQWNSIFSALKRPGSPAPATKYSSFRSIATGEKKKRGRKKKENRIKQGKKISTLVLRQGKADYSSKNMVYRSSDGQSKVRKIISVPINSRSRLHSHYPNPDLSFILFFPQWQLTQWRDQCDKSNLQRVAK